MVIQNGTLLPKLHLIVARLSNTPIGFSSSTLPSYSCRTIVQYTLLCYFAMGIFFPNNQDPSIVKLLTLAWLYSNGPYLGVTLSYISIPIIIMYEGTCLYSFCWIKYMTISFSLVLCKLSCAKNVKTLELSFVVFGKPLLIWSLLLCLICSLVLE